MSDRSPWVLLVLAILVAWSARTSASVPFDEASAAHLRRAELTMASGSAPLNDRFLDPPRGAPVPAPPFFDSALATVAHLALSESGGYPALKGVSEKRFERFASLTSPALGALTALGIFLAISALVRGPARTWAALLGAALFALTPGAVEVARAGRVDDWNLQALLLAFSLAIVAQTVRARDDLDVLQGGMTCGVVAGLALATGPAALLFVPLLWVGFFAVARAANARAQEDNKRAEASRAGLFFAIVAALVVSFGLRRGAEGIGAKWLSGASELSFAAGIPFLLASLRDSRGTRRRTWFGFGVGALATAALLPLGVWHVAQSLAPQLSLLWRGELERAPGTDLLTWAVWLALLPVIGFLLLRAAPLAAPKPDAGAPPADRYAVLARGAHPALFAWLIATAVVVACTGRGAALLAVAASVTGAVAWAGARERWSEVRANAVAVAIVALLGVQAYMARPLDHGRERTLAAGLVWMRANTPSPGPWNAASSPKDWSVLAPAGLGHRIAYHGRRPPLASGYGPLVAPESARAAAQLFLATDIEELVRGMRAQGASYVLAGAAACDQWDAVCSAAGVERRLSDSALWALTTRGGEDPEGAPLARVHALGSAEVALDGGAVTVPEVVLYRLAGPAGPGDGVDGVDGAQLGPARRAR